MNSGPNYVLDFPSPSTSGMRSCAGATLVFGLVVTIEIQLLSRTAASRNTLAPGSLNRYCRRTGLSVFSLDPLGHVSLVEGAHRHETAALRYGLRPHVAPTQAQLIEGGLYACVEDDVGPSVEGESPREAGTARSLSFST